MNALASYTHARSQLLASLPIGVAVDALRRASRSGVIYVCGCGGSYAEALHLVGELIGGMRRKDGREIHAVTLGAEAAALTAWANDCDWTTAYARQLRCASGWDALIALTTSGRSRVVLEAVRAARAKSMTTIAITGEAGLATEADLVIRVPSTDTAIVQEATLAIVHAIAEAVEGA